MPFAIAGRRQYSVSDIPNYLKARSLGAKADASIDQLKFKAPVPPGALLDLTLTHDASRQRVQFVYRLGGRDCTLGIIVYRGIA